MRAAFRAGNRHALLTKAGVILVANIFFSNWSPKARPSSARLKLGLGTKKRIVTTDTAIKSLLVKVEVFTRKRSFRALLACHFELQRRQLLLPLRICLNDPLDPGRP